MTGHPKGCLGMHLCYDVSCDSCYQLAKKYKREDFAVIYGEPSPAWKTGKFANANGEVY